MKKLKLSLASIAVAIALFGAMSTHASNHKIKAGDPDVYYWYQTDDGSGPQDQATIDEETTARSCSTGSIVCANGYTASQFNGGLPANGLKDGEAENPATVLYKH